MTKDIEKAEVCKSSSAWSLLVRPTFSNPSSLRQVRKSGAKMTYPWWRNNFREYLNKLHVLKSMRPDRMHP